MLTTDHPGENPKQAAGDKKVPLHTVPPVALVYLGLAFGEGAAKYDPYNFRETPVRTMTYIGAAQRHLCAFLDGENTDRDSGLPHIALGMACLAIIADGLERDVIIDDRPARGACGDVLRRYEGHQYGPADVVTAGPDDATLAPARNGDSRSCKTCGARPGAFHASVCKSAR